MPRFQGQLSTHEFWLHFCPLFLPPFLSDRANFHAKSCFCLSSFFWCFAMLIFTSFWEVGFFFVKKKHLHFLEVPKFCKKMAVPTSWIFWLTGKRQADVGQTSGTSGDVGQTSGRRRARRARNVGQTSGTSGELKVVETGKKSPPMELRWKKLKKRNLSCDAQNFVKIRLSKHPNFEDVGRQFWEHFWTGGGQRPQFWPGRIAFLGAVMCLWLQSLG